MFLWRIKTMARKAQTSSADPNQTPNMLRPSSIFITHPAVLDISTGSRIGTDITGEKYVLMLLTGCFHIGPVSAPSLVLLA